MIQNNKEDGFSRSVNNGVNPANFWWGSVKNHVPYRLISKNITNETKFKFLFILRVWNLIPCPKGRTLMKCAREQVTEGETWVLVTAVWRVLRLRIEERPPIRRVAANKLNK